MVDKASLSRGAFLLCLSHTGNLTIAAEFAGVNRAQIRAIMAQEESFKTAVAEAMGEAEERVFHHAMRRAIEAAISYTDAGTASKADSSEFGLKFTTAIGVGDLTFQFAQANTSDNGTDANTGGKDTSFGVNLGLGDLTLRAASNKSEPDGGEEKDVIDLGLSYKLNSDVVLGLYNRDGENGYADVAETGVSLTYTVAPSLSTNVVYTTSEEGDDDSSATTAYIKVAF